MRLLLWCLLVSLILRLLLLIFIPLSLITVGPLIFIYGLDVCLLTARHIWSVIERQIKKRKLTAPVSPNDSNKISLIKSLASIGNYRIALLLLLVSFIFAMALTALEDKLNSVTAIAANFLLAMIFITGHGIFRIIAGTWSQRQLPVR